jgi:hypothetical protein
LLERDKDKMTEKKQIPFLYKYIHNKMREQSKKGIMKTWEFRMFVGRTINIKKEFAPFILEDLQRFSLIEYDEEKEIIRIKKGS